MAYRFDARGRRAPLAAALAAVMFGGVGADAYAGSSGDNRKIGAKPEEVTARLYQSPLERIRAKYGLKQEQPGTDPLVGANANPGQKFKADANRGKPGKVDMNAINRLAKPKVLKSAKTESNPGHKFKADANGVKTRKVDMDAINRLAQPKVLKSAKTESKPEVQPRRVGSKAKPGGDSQRKGGVVRSMLLRPPHPYRGDMPKPSVSPSPDQPLGSVLQPPVKPVYKRMLKLEADKAQVERQRLEIDQARYGKRQAPPYAVRYRNAELKHLSEAAMITALLESNEARSLFNVDAEHAERARAALVTLLAIPEGMPENEPGLQEEIEQLSQEALARAFATALPDQRYTVYTFRHALGREIEPQLSGDRVFGYRLREVMPFAHLPYPGNIAAVVARVTAPTADHARYVVAHFDDQGQLHAPGGFAGRGSNSDADQDVGLPFDSAQLTMDKVEFVIYRPHRDQSSELF